MNDSTASSAPFRVGEWLPSDQQALDAWLQQLIEEVDPTAELHPVVDELRQLIETDPQLYMLFDQMFSQVPTRPPYDKSPDGKPQVRDYRLMLQLINAIMTRAPEFNKTGLVGFPINAILDWSMATPSGFAAFLNPKLNLQLKKVLNEWGRFLASPDSRYVLNEYPPTGWLSPEAKEAMGFDDFKSDPSQPYAGFRSWDDFLLVGSRTVGGRSPNRATTPSW
ncbi:phophatidylserine decarboxylase associated domain-containing protein [Alkalilimnicola ehrlichii]|uniref:phophatidylserine decarboxylase associated domain-containing protein n=1 Tax=Alkalilimnicola ehrlichii TaxID=351052 RepID=UPI001C6F2FE6|nr:phophatidylserine decarboxylase associated domain-containing protein [Alkalilimnicola ehrlichii]